MLSKIKYNMKKFKKIRGKTKTKNKTKQKTLAIGRLVTRGY